MGKLEFEGIVINGIGKHSELFVPGRLLLPQAPTDWPETLHPGSLNVRVVSYPAVWRERGLAASVKVLDTGVFPPAFLILREQFGNNQLLPTPSKPSRGIGQVWRAALFANDHRMDCWVLRRIDSGLRDVVELIADCAIRNRMNLEATRDWPATIAVYGAWRGAG